jgi:Transmembrane protein 254
MARPETRQNGAHRTTEPVGPPPAVERPHAGWWIAIGGGIGLLALVALDARAFALWSAHVTAAIPRGVLRAVLVGTVLVHVAEAAYARRLALRLGLAGTAAGWFWQTLLLGFPSLRLLARRARPAV